MHLIALGPAVTNFLPSQSISRPCLSRNNKPPSPDRIQYIHQNPPFIAITILSPLKRTALERPANTPYTESMALARNFPSVASLREQGWRCS